MVINEPKPRRFTRKEYYAMGDMGLFVNQRVELIEGEIILMCPQGIPHGGLIRSLNSIFTKLTPSAYSVGVQLPLDLGLRTEPEPDLSISKGTPSDFFGHHPKNAELVIEIANSSVNYDRTKKGSLYAKAGIPEFWLINLPDKCVEIYREPIKAKGEVFGFKYVKREVLRSGAIVSPLFLPSVTIEVKDLLP